MNLHEEWLFKASHDLESSLLLFESNKNLLDICVYHTQQCAEKSLKAFLVYLEQDIPKTHNLIFLLNKCSVMDYSFESLMDAAVFINPFSTLFRYPEGDLLPSREETEKAIEYAQEIYHFTKSKIA